MHDRIPNVPYVIESLNEAISTCVQLQTAPTPLIVQEVNEVAQHQVLGPINAFLIAWPVSCGFQLADAESSVNQHTKTDLDFSNEEKCLGNSLKLDGNSLAVTMPVILLSPSMTRT